MSVGGFLRDKLLHILAALFAACFTAVLLTVLRVHPSAVAFICLVTLLGTLLPLAVEYGRKRSFYNQALARLDALEEKYLFAALLEAPAFSEGAIFCAAVEEMSAAMTGQVAAARRDMTEYREYIEAWVHEAKTPIASAHLLLENNPGPLTLPLEEELFKLDERVEQALFYARSGAVDRDYLVKALPLKEVCAAAVKRQARPLIGAGFQIDLSALDGVVYSDGKWVEFILGQLLSNAVKYHSPRPKLTFTQTVGPTAVTLHVHDNGVGIPAADLGRVFEKGFTGQNGRAGLIKSTGLGLYLSKKLCNCLGLGVTLASQQGTGTTVSLTFPKGRFHLAE